jgi:tetratricopeptide (TPR) repeat protein
MIKISNQKKLLLALMIIGSFIMIEAAVPRRAVANNAPAFNSNTLFDEGNRLYEKGEYAKAVQIYLKLAANGYENGNLDFNLGNAYYKLGQKGLSILYYEKARRLIPFDKDLKTNINIALMGVDEGEINWGHEFYRILVCLAPLNWLVLGSSISFYLMILLIIFRILCPSYTQNSQTRHMKLWYKITFGLVSCFLICLIALTTFGYLDQRQAQAIVIKGNATALSEPSPNATIYFKLSEGSRILVNSTKGNWCLIKRQDGKRGWIERQYLEQL